MGVSYNTSVVTDGLVLSLDAANIKSYPGTGTTWYDISGNSNNSTLTNGPSYSNSVFTFDGTNDYAVSNISCNKTYYSINWWLYPTTLANYNQWMAFNDAWNNWVWHTVVDGSCYVGTNTATRMTPTNIPAGTIVANTWQNLTYTFNNGIGAFYKNGKLIASKSGIDVSLNTFTTFYIGSLASPTNTINGKIGYVQVYSNKVLTDSEVNQNFNALRGRYGI